MKREIEIKYLLKDKAAREEMVAELSKRYPGMQHKGTKRVISYFYKAGATHDQVLAAARRIVPADKLEELESLLRNSEALVVKCRSIDDANQFAVKGTPAGEDPVHAVNRLEFEVVLDMELEAIGKALEDAGIEIASKWSSVRDFYELDSVMKADIEFLAGYGHKAELEIVINDGESSEEAVSSLNALADELGLVEAKGELLAKMYAYYNEHWQEYFNTDNVFSDEVWQQLGR